MKIVLVNKYWYIRGGAERVVFATKKVLEDAGHEVEIFGMKHPKNDIENEYFIDYMDYDHANIFEKFVYGLKSVYNGDAKRKFEQLVQDFEPDVIHFHNIYHQLSFSLLDVVKKYNIPAVMTLHDYKIISPDYNLYHHGQIDTSTALHYYNVFLKNALGNWGRSFFAMIEMYLRWIKKWNNNIAVYISPSQFLKRCCLTYGLDKPIDVVENPIDMTIYDMKGIHGEGVLYVGRLSEEKGVRELLSIAEQTPDITYTIVGDGPLYKELSEKSVSNVILVGYQTGDALRSYMDTARLFIMPSQWYENYPLTILEAKAQGKVLVASDIGGISEMLPSTMLCQPDDLNNFVATVRQWYDTSPKKLLEAGKNLRKDVAYTNTMHIYQKKLLSVYEKIV